MLLIVKRFESYLEHARNHLELQRLPPVKTPAIFTTLERLLAYPQKRRQVAII